MMVDIIFKEVSEENWEECIKLEVSEEQKNFVAPNYYSILEAKFSEDWIPLCIYDGDTMVGFIMYGTDKDTQRVEMCRLMMDKKYQGKGYGKAAVKRLLNIIEKEYGNIKFYTSTEPHNICAQKVYESMGFKKTGEIMWDEEVMMIEL